MYIQRSTRDENKHVKTDVYETLIRLVNFYLLSNACFGHTDYGNKNDSSVAPLDEIRICQKWSWPDWLECNGSLYFLDRRD